MFIIAAMLAAAQAAPAAPPPLACDSAEHRQFDFWVGRWDVYRPDTGKLVAHSLVEKLYAGCAIRENWMPLQGTGGGSLNTYRPEKSVWRQVWTDSLNNLNEYAGSFANGVMTLTGLSHPARGAPAPVRMTYEAKPDGSVVQTGYRSADRGQSWQLSYQFVYRRSPQH
ncbi:MAG TPA: hypothetical protein VF027_07215 [Sphingomicrobium sp.]